MTKIEKDKTIGVIIKEENDWYSQITNKVQEVNRKNKFRWSGRVRTSTKINNHNLAVFEDTLTRASPNGDENVEKTKSLDKKTAERSRRGTSLKNRTGGITSLFGRNRNQKRDQLAKRGIIKSGYFGSSIQNIQDRESVSN